MYRVFYTYLAFCENLHPFSNDKIDAYNKYQLCGYSNQRSPPGIFMLYMRYVLITA